MASMSSDQRVKNYLQVIVPDYTSKFLSARNFFDDNHNYKRKFGYI
jgi:hypothetical protein